MKANDIRELTPEELQHQYEESVREHFNLRVQQSTGQIENPLRIRKLRREIARLKTIMMERRRRSKQDDNRG